MSRAWRWRSRCQDADGSRRDDRSRRSANEEQRRPVQVSWPSTFDSPARPSARYDEPYIHRLRWLPAVTIAAEPSRKMIRRSRTKVEMLHQGAMPWENGMKLAGNSIWSLRRARDRSGHRAGVAAATTSRAAIPCIDRLARIQVVRPPPLMHTASRPGGTSSSAHAARRARGAGEQGLDCEGK